jgi:hypothetical protein
MFSDDVRGRIKINNYGLPGSRKMVAVAQAPAVTIAQLLIVMIWGGYVRHGEGLANIGVLKERYR